MKAISSSILCLGAMLLAAPALRGQDFSKYRDFSLGTSLANVLKHASAKETTVRLSSVNGSLQVEVIDDGCGFDAARVTRSGLSGLEDRIEAVGGTLSITSRLQGGTRIMARLPVRRASPV